MMPAVFDQTTVDILAKADRGYNFRVTGSVIKFDGFLKVYEESKDKKDDEDEALANKLPALDERPGAGTERCFSLSSTRLSRLPRYNEASLVKELEEHGIGRPSTYASIINTIQDREYVQKMGVAVRSRLFPPKSALWSPICSSTNFPYIFDPKYTARLEEELDDIEDGQREVDRPAGRLLWALRRGAPGRQQAHGRHQADGEADGREVRFCGSPLVLKWGKFGSFFACSAYDKKDPRQLHLHQREL